MQYTAVFKIKHQPEKMLNFVQRLVFSIRMSISTTCFGFLDYFYSLESKSTIEQFSDFYWFILRNIWKKIYINLDKTIWCNHNSIKYFWVSIAFSRSRRLNYTRIDSELIFRRLHHEKANMLLTTHRKRCLVINDTSTMKKVIFPARKDIYTMFSRNVPGRHFVPWDSHVKSTTIQMLLCKIKMEICVCV